jgi:hypothetical protein
MKKVATIILAMTQLFLRCGKEFGLDRNLEDKYIKCIEPEDKLFDQLVDEFSKEGYWFPFLKASGIEGSIIMDTYQQLAENKSLALSFNPYL